MIKFNFLQIYWYLHLQTRILLPANVPKPRWKENANDYDENYVDDDDDDDEVPSWF